MSDSKPPEWHAAKLDFKADLDYARYLALDRILSAQHPLSPDANEMLFIIQHQTSELWMKLILHELDRAIIAIRADELPPAFKMLARVSRIMEQLVKSWDVLATMTPPEYSAIRPWLGQSSGFQSYQYRAIEFRLGNKNRTLIEPHRHDADRAAALEVILKAPSIYDEAIALLGRRGFIIPVEVATRDVTIATSSHDAVETAWASVYAQTTQYWDLYELAEELIDLEDAFRQWRFRHVSTVERIIGFKRGTGGTVGVSYLRKMLDVVLFPDLWRLRTRL